METVSSEAGTTWRPPLAELALAAAFAAIGVLITTGALDGRAALGGTALTVGHSAVLAWRRRVPELVLAAQGATGIAVVVAGWPPVILGPALLAGVHGLGAVRDRDRALPVLAATVVVMGVLVSMGGNTLDTVIGNVIGVCGAWWLGDRQRQTQQRAADAEAGAAQLARRAVADERMRIARELHDVVAHALSVIAVQAGSGRVVIDTDADTARSALSSIEQESRAALDEMRRLLSVLRDDEADGPLEPSPGLDDLETLVASTVRSGLPVEVHLCGERTRMPAGAELAAYRIVQEALTNARKHADATQVEVWVTWRPGALHVEVTDDGRGAGHPDPGGHGLVGMQERAALYGGWIEVGDRPGGGYRVAASIPCGTAP